MSNITDQFTIIVATMKHNMHFVLLLMVILWGVQLINWMLHYKLNLLGILPRHPLGLIGIGFAPFLHGDFRHLFFNSFPLFIFIHLVLLEGRHAFMIITIFIIMVCGLLTWIFGRKAIHIGASGVIMGYLGYLLANAYYQQTAVAIILAVVCLYYFGGMLSSVIPTDKKSSWEGHLFGLLAGVAASYVIPMLIA